MALKIETIEVGQMQANCYLVWDPKTLECLVIDPGDAGEYIIQKILDLKLDPQAVVATHGHLDHVMAATELVLAFNIPFLMNTKDVFLLDRQEATAQHFLGFKSDPPPKITGDLGKEKSLKFQNLVFEIIPTPGHTPGSVSLYCKEEAGVFVGDLIFANGVGRTDFKYANETKLNTSIRKILALPDATMVYSGHGKPFTVEYAKEKFQNYL